MRLWNYADGTPEDALVSARFRGASAGGWGGEDPVWAGDVDRMFVSLVAPGYHRRRMRRWRRRPRAGRS